MWAESLAALVPPTPVPHLEQLKLDSNNIC
jgi:NLR family CARD domain-containing protein 3